MPMLCFNWDGVKGLGLEHETKNTNSVHSQREYQRETFRI